MKHPDAVERRGDRAEAAQQREAALGNRQPQSQREAGGDAHRPRPQQRPHHVRAVMRSTIALRQASGASTAHSRAIRADDLDAGGLLVSVHLRQRRLVQPKATADDERTEAREDDGDDDRQARRPQPGNHGHLPVGEHVRQEAHCLGDRDHDDPPRAKCSNTRSNETPLTAATAITARSPPRSPAPRGRAR